MTAYLSVLKGKFTLIIMKAENCWEKSQTLHSWDLELEQPTQSGKRMLNVSVTERHWLKDRSQLIKHPCGSQWCLDHGLWGTSGLESVPTWSPSLLLLQLESICHFLNRDLPCSFYSCPRFTDLLKTIFDQLGWKRTLACLCTRLSWGSFWWQIWMCRGSHKYAKERTTNHLRSTATCSSKGLLRKQANSVSCWAGYTNQPAGPAALRFSTYTPPVIFTNVSLLGN